MKRIIFVLFAVLLIAAIIVANHYVPFQVGSMVVYTGIVILGLGLLSVIKPFRFIHIKTRKSSLLLAVAGLLILMVGMILPAPTIRSTGSHQRIDDFMPEYQFYEHHEVAIKAPMEKVAAAIKEVSFADIPAAIWLMRARSLGSGPSFEPAIVSTRPILELLSQPGTGFLTLDGNDPVEYVGGMVGRPWSNDQPPAISTPDEFNAFRLAGNIKVAFNMHAVDMGDGTVLLTTETRIIGNDASARKTFARYWRVIYPGSSIIRRVWLDAIADRATGG